MIDPDVREGPTISELVQHCVDQGVNTRELARRSEGKVAHQRFEDLRHGKVVGFPRSAEAVEAQARALGVSGHDLLLAYARQLGIYRGDEQPYLASMLPASAKRLTIRQARLLVDLIEQLAPASTATVLDLSRFPLEELRDVTEFWQELGGRRNDASPALAAVMGYVMATIDAAIADATTEQ